MKKLGKAYLGLVLFFLYIPIFVLIVFSFNETKSRSVFSGFTFEWYERLFNNNGIKIIHPLRADITKVDNGDYYVELQDTIESLDFYQSGMIVRIPTPWGVQGFRCKNTTVKNLHDGI